MKTKRKKVIRAGPLVMVVVYTPPMPYEKKEVRDAKRKHSSAARQKINLRTAKQKLEVLLAENFGYYDIHLVLTYDNDHLPRTRAEADKELKKFLRNLREYRRRNGLEELKYVYVTEDKHADGRLHHHVVLNATGKDYDTFRRIWGRGNVHGEYVAKRDYDGLAAYITKKRVDNKPRGAQLWTPSKNLRRPKPELTWVDDDTGLRTPYGCEEIEKGGDENYFGGWEYIKYKVKQPKPETAWLDDERRKPLSPLKSCITLRHIEKYRDAGQGIKKAPTGKKASGHKRKKVLDNSIPKNDDS